MKLDKSFLRRTAASFKHRLWPASERPALEALDLAHLQSLLGGNVTVMLEIGANDGHDTQRLLDAFPTAAMHCFEPDPRAYALLCDRIVSERATIYPVAISAADGPIEFFQSSGAPPGREEEFPNGWHLSGSIRKPKLHLEQHPWCDFDTSIDVEGFSLDTWSAQHGIHAIDFIWADVQGAEADLVRGGTRTLGNTRFLYTEFDNAELYEGQLPLDALLELLPNWEIESRYKHDVLLRNTAVSAPASAPTDPSSSGTDETKNRSEP